MTTIRVQSQYPYDVCVGRGLLEEAGSFVKPYLRAEKLLLVTDENVDALYADSVLRSLFSAYGRENAAKLVLPAGEKNKNIQNYLKIVEAMAAFGLKRTDAVLALGGGVTGDLAGFAAATYMRGIDCVQLPTTLLAMIDSCVGGKTGVDLQEGKNLLGAFHSPRVVLIDTNALATLSDAEYKNGLGEGVKYAVLERSLMPFLLANREDPEAFIAKCVALKAEIVRRDEHDEGVRRALNLGHTVAHALEAASGYGQSHGIAVAKGISVMTSAAQRVGEISKRRAEEIFEALKLVGVGSERVFADELAPYISRDKKADGEGINAVTVSENGVETRRFSTEEFLRYITKTDVKVHKSTLKGRVCAHQSKSIAHRYLIASHLAGAMLELDGGDDVLATERCLKALARAEERGEERVVLDVGESGSTLRFLLPVVCARGISASFVGHGRLGQRPIGELVRVLKEHGADISATKEENALLTTAGRLRAGEYVVDGSASSQYVTGLLMALPLLDGDSVLTVTGKASSASYVELTLDALKLFSIDVEGGDGHYRIKGGQRYKVPSEAHIEGDWSSASTLLAAGALAGEARVEGLEPASRQGDRAVVELLRRAGADITFENGAYIAKKSRLHGIDFDAEDIPDLVPIMATALSFAEGESHISSVGRLRGKESDRLSAILALLGSFGVRAGYDDDKDILTVSGKREHAAGEYQSFHDHRVAMSAIVAALATDGECRVNGAECIGKSYPNFIADMRALGARIEEE